MTERSVGVRRPRRRWIAYGAAVMLAAAAAPQTANAERIAYPPGAFSLSLGLSVVAPGATVQAVAAGCTADVNIRLEVVGAGVSATATCVASTASQLEDQEITGSATFTFQAPNSVGVYTVRASELGGQGRSATSSLTVSDTGVAAPTTTIGDELPPTGDGDGDGGGGSGGGTGGSGTGGGTLPKSGSDTGPLLATAAAALVLGGGLAVVARRRRQRPAAAA